MSLKKIGQIKEGKWFRGWDLIVYGVIAVTVAALFLSVFLTRDSSPASGIRITYAGATVFEYDYSTDKYGSVNAGCIEINGDSDEKLELTFRPNGGGYNRVVIDKKNRSVKVVDADCSARKDCVYSPAITDNSLIICCTPHKMIIEPLKRTFKDDEDIII